MTSPRKASWEILSVAAAAAVLAACVAGLLSTRPASISIRDPDHPGSVLRTVDMTLPPIGPFESFQVNDANPFVPWQDRAREAVHSPPERVPPIAAPPPEQPRGRPLVLPSTVPGGGDAPQLRGFVSGRGVDRAILVLLPGETRPRLMKPSERVGRWTFIAIEDGNVALFGDENERQYRLVIGSR